MLSVERRVAIEAARAAGALLRDALSATHRIAYKASPVDLVTEMDARAETLIVERLSAAFPDDAVLAEERGTRPGRSGRRWIVDPLDGTTNYAHGLPVFAVSIALEVRPAVVLGVVYDPVRDELYVGERGRGALCNDAPLAVSTTTNLDASLLTTGFPYDLRTNPDNNLREYAVLSRRARAVRRIGSVVIDLAWVAAGRFDGYWELRLGAWDVAAGALLVEEAGGRVTGITGAPLDLERPTLLATNGRIHDTVLAILAETRGG